MNEGGSEEEEEDEEGDLSGSGEEDDGPMKASSLAQIDDPLPD